MKKIKDKHILGVITGVVGGLAMLLTDHISYKYLKISKRSYPDASAGIWVGSKRQAQSKSGTVLGITMSLFTSMLGSIIMTEIIARRGKNNINTKGIFYGAVYGGIITALQSALPNNKLKPKDSSSNLSYLFSNSLYGLVTANCIARLGDDSLFPKSDVSNHNVRITHNDDYYQKSQSQFPVRPETQESYFQSKIH